MPELRLDLRNAYESGETEHPQILMKKLGYNILKSEPIPIADCWIFEVEELILPLPEYLKLLED